MRRGSQQSADPTAGLLLERRKLHFQLRNPFHSPGVEAAGIRQRLQDRERGGDVAAGAGRVEIGEPRMRHHRVQLRY